VQPEPRWNRTNAASAVAGYCFDDASVGPHGYATEAAGASCCRCAFDNTLDLNRVPVRTDNAQKTLASGPGAGKSFGLRCVKGRVRERLGVVNGRVSAPRGLRGGVRLQNTLRLVPPTLLHPYHYRTLPTHPFYHISLLIHRLLTSSLPRMIQPSALRRPCVLPPPTSSAHNSTPTPLPNAPHFPMSPPLPLVPPPPNPFLHPHLHIPFPLSL